jgi:GxxExxY protein
MKTKDPLSYKVIGCTMEVYNTLGPGLLESAYEKALLHELQINGLSATSQVPIEMSYKGINLGEGLRLDILIEDSLIVELKSVEELKPIHYKQLLTYLKLTNKHTGLLINFNVNDFRDGIKRVINGY